MTGPRVFAVARGCFIVAPIAIPGAVTVGDPINFMFIQVGGNQLAGDRLDAAGAVECAEPFPGDLEWSCSQAANRKRARPEVNCD